MSINLQNKIAGLSYPQIDNNLSSLYPANSSTEFHNSYLASNDFPLSAYQVIKQSTKPLSLLEVCR